MLSRSGIDGSIKSVVILLGLFGLHGCTDPELKPIPKEGVILAFGDSLTAGYGADKSTSYPRVLSELSGRIVINAGISGETTDRGLERLPVALSQTEPDLLILLEGGNDILRSYDLAVTKQNLAAMIELAQERGIQVVLLGVPGKNLFLSMAPLYEELADEYQLVFEGHLIANLLRSPVYKSDTVHLNEKGYRAMAEAIHELLSDRGAF